jgi:energy-coupling factor transporter ATP-binding protein EcfA2
MTKRKIERVTFNIKTGDGSSRSYRMTEKNLIVGPNGSGKSAVQQAVALALTGAVDNLSGRPVVSDPKMIARMGYRSGGDKRQVFAEVELDQGERCRWDVMQHTEGTGLLRPSHVRPRWVVPQTSKDNSPHMPMRDVNNLLLASPKKARERLLTLVGAAQDPTHLKTLSGLTEEQMVLVEQLTPAMEDCAFVDRLASAAVQADKLMREANADVKAASNLMVSLAEKTGMRVGPQAVLAARDKLRQAEELYEDAVAHSNGGNEESRKLLENMLSELRTQEQRLVQREREAFQKQRESPVDLDEIDGVDGALKALEWSLSEGFEQCPICSSNVGRKHLETCQTFYRDRQQSHDEVAKLTEVMVQCDQELTRLRREIERLAQDLNELPVVSHKTLTQEDVEAARSVMERLREQHREVVARDLAWIDYDVAEIQVGKATARAADMQSAKRVFQKAAKKILLALVEDFEDRVRTYLSDKWLFGLFVGDDRSDAFYPGLYAAGHDRDSEYLMELSEGQRAAALAAMASALHSYNPVSLACITVEDRGYDVDTLGRVLQNLVDAEPTVIMTTTTLPHTQDTEGWNVINLYDEEQTGTVRSRTRNMLPPPPTLQVEEPKPEEDPLPALPERLAAGPDAPNVGRARGGRFRSARNCTRKFLSEHGELAISRLVLSFPLLELELDDNTDFIAEKVASFLTPLGPGATP